MKHTWAKKQATRPLGLLVIVSLLALWTAPLRVHAAGTWTNQNPGAYPSQRYRHAIASLGGDHVLLFGGYDGLLLGDTWVYDLSAGTWMPMTPTSGSSPSARHEHAMAYLGEDQALLFGGDTGGGFSGDTWVYDLEANAWTDKNPTSSPPPQYRHAMAYLGGDQVLLFGGWSSSGLLADTWVYDLSDNAWTNKSPATSPPARGYHAMASLGEGQVLLFGGWTDNGYNAETWVYNLSTNTWTPLTLTTSPAARYGHAMAPLGGDQVLLFGGLAGSDYAADTWIYDFSDNAWTQETPIAYPSERYLHAMAHLGSGQVLLFGGYADGYSSETWLADGFGPTAVTLASFSAAAEGTTIHLQWETASEVDSLGFNLYRASTPTGARVGLNDTLIPAHEPGSQAGARYDWIDSDGLRPGQDYAYWLEAVDVYGQGQFLGQVDATAGMEYRLYLPLVAR